MYIYSFYKTGLLTSFIVIKLIYTNSISPEDSKLLNPSEIRIALPKLVVTEKASPSMRTDFYRDWSTPGVRQSFVLQAIGIEAHLEYDALDTVPLTSGKELEERKLCFSRVQGLIWKFFPS